MVSSLKRSMCGVRKEEMPHEMKSCKLQRVDLMTSGTLEWNERDEDKEVYGNIS